MKNITKAQKEILKEIKKISKDDYLINNSLDEYISINTWSEREEYDTKIYPDGVFFTSHRGYGKSDIWSDWEKKHNATINHLYYKTKGE